MRLTLKKKHTSVAAAKDTWISKKTQTRTHTHTCTVVLPLIKKIFQTFKQLSKIPNKLSDSVVGECAEEVTTRCL